MAKRELYESVLRYLAEQRDTGHHPVSQADIAAALGESPSTGLPDLFRAVHRDAISELVSRVVRDGHPLNSACRRKTQSGSRRSSKATLRGSVSTTSLATV